MDIEIIFHLHRFPISHVIFLFANYVYYVVAVVDSLVLDPAFGEKENEIIDLNDYKILVSQLNNDKIIYTFKEYVG